MEAGAAFPQNSKAVPELDVAWKKVSEQVAAFEAELDRQRKDRKRRVSPRPAGTAVEDAQAEVEEEEEAAQLPPREPGARARAAAAAEGRQRQEQPEEAAAAASAAALGEEEEEPEPVPLVKEVGPACIKHERLEWKFSRDGGEPLSEEGRSQAALQRAIVSGTLRQIQDLVKAGAPLVGNYVLDGDALEPSQGTALDLALHARRYKVALWLLQSDEKRAQLLADKSCRAVAFAARDGRVQILRELLERNAEVVLGDERGRSPLLLAAKNGHKQCCHLLFDAGAYDLEPYKEGLVKEWLRHWRIDEVGNPNEPYASTEVQDPEVEELDAPPSPQPKAKPRSEQPGALHVRLARAIAYEGVKEVEKLVSAGALLSATFYLDKELQDSGTALDLAISARRFKLALKLLERPEAGELAAASTRAVALASLEGQELLVRRLLDLKADAGQQDAEGKSALLLAAKRGHKMCVANLIEAKAWTSETQREEVQEWAARWKLAGIPPEA